MADLKISELTNLTAADPANDMIPIVDVSATPPASGSTKRISINNILACSPTATLASATITGDLTVDTSTLKVDSANNFVGVGTTTGVNLAAGRGNLTIGGSSSAILNLSIGAVDTGYLIHGGTDISLVNRTVTGGIIFGVNSTTAMTLNSTGLGVGGSPTGKIHAQGTGVLGLFTQGAAPAAALSAVTIQAPVASGFSSLPVLNFWYQNTGISNPANECFAIRTSSTDRLYVDATGNVGIGVTPIERLTVAGTASVGGTGNIGVKFHSGNPVTGNLAWLLSNDSANSNILNLYYYNAGVFSGRAFVVNQSGNFMVRTPSTPPTIPDNEMMVFNLTSNTNLRISVKGTDGTTRTANITLA